MCVSRASGSGIPVWVSGFKILLVFEEALSPLVLVDEPPPPPPPDLNPPKKTARSF